MLYHRKHDNNKYVDVGYYGHTVYYLSRILGERLHGFFFTVNRQNTNICVSSTEIKGCFQQDDDDKAHDTGIYRMGGLFDAYLTSPDGMFIGFDENGGRRFSKKMHNQLDFAAREEINRGVLDYIKTVIGLVGSDENINPLFADAVFKKWFESGTIFSDEVKEAFYFDNAFSHSGEYRIL